MMGFGLFLRKTKNPADQSTGGKRSRPSIALWGVASLTIFLSGCATLNQTECLHADWFSIGQVDGQTGHPISRLEAHRGACLKHGVVPDATAYAKGREEGLKSYCIPYNAITEGLAGRRYQGVCPGAIDRDFRELNAAAYAVYDLRNDIESTHSQIRNLESDLRKNKTSEKRKREIREDLRDLDRKHERLRDELRWKERDLDRLSEAIPAARHRY